MGGTGTELRLGLIGDNIAASSAPRLHRLAGRLSGIEVVYDRLVPRELGLDFEGTFAAARADGRRGLNITYPYKERVLSLLTVPDPDVAALGAVNTVLFEPDGAAIGWNTDFTGFMAAYAEARGGAAPGRVAVIGTGGVGRAVLFGLLRLGAAALVLVDRDRARAEAVAKDLRRHTEVPVEVADSAEAAAAEAEGVVNCTPVGMVGYEGTPIDAAALPRAGWAFDAVYTPVDTQFLRDAATAGLATISGYELFFWQGVHAWRHFSGRDVDAAALRAALAASEGDPR